MWALRHCEDLASTAGEEGSEHRVLGPDLGCKAISLVTRKTPGIGAVEQVGIPGRRLLGEEVRLGTYLKGEPTGLPSGWG